MPSTTHSSRRVPEPAWRPRCRRAPGGPSAICSTTCTKCSTAGIASPRSGTSRSTGSSSPSGPTTTISWTCFVGEHAGFSAVLRRLRPGDADLHVGRSAAALVAHPAHGAGDRRAPCRCRVRLRPGATRRRQVGQRRHRRVPRVLPQRPRSVRWAAPCTCTARTWTGSGRCASSRAASTSRVSTPRATAPSAARRATSSWRCGAGVRSAPAR